MIELDETKAPVLLTFFKYLCCNFVRHEFQAYDDPI